MRKLLLILLCTSAAVGLSDAYVTAELGPVFQSRNDVGIPSDTGTRFSLVDAKSGPFFAYRFYGGSEIDERHGLRLLIAPLKVSASGTYNQDIDFAGKTYVAGTPLDATYQFNSYRLTYRYRILMSEVWNLHVGFTAKIRDARVALAQGATSSESTNVGFVPLLHFAASYQLDTDWRLFFDLDGLMAPQGRAFDATLQAAWTASPELELSAGYRTVEGGAENKTVFSFAWLHYFVFAAAYRF